MKIVLIRHLAPSVAPGICYGRLDVPVAPAQHNQAAAIVAHPALAGAATVHSSPARRCSVLAAAVATALPAPLMIDERLRELDFGDWEGNPWDSIARAELDRWAPNPFALAPPGGETGAALVRRISEFVADIEQARCDCVIVSHGGPLKVLTALLEGRPVDLLTAAPPFGSVRCILGDRSLHRLEPERWNPRDHAPAKR
jgi:alpha-ribazole phosphatase